MKHILVVDDDTDLSRAFKLRLESSGDFVVSTAENGEEALRFVERAAPDLIVMDVLMPKMDGLTTLKAINRMMERKVPAIIVTGKAILTQDVFKLEGAHDFLTKPVDGAHLMKRVKEILAGTR